MAAKLRLDHGALAALLVPTPTPAIIVAIHTVLAAHNSLEEGPGGANMAKTSFTPVGNCADSSGRHHLKEQ